MKLFLKPRLRTAHASGLVSAAKSPWKQPVGPRLCMLGATCLADVQHTGHATSPAHRRGKSFFRGPRLLPSQQLMRDASAGKGS